MSQTENVIVTIGQPDYSCPKTVKIQITLEAVNEQPIKPMRPVVVLSGAMSGNFDFTAFAASDDSPFASGNLTFYEHSLGDFHVNASTLNNIQAGSADGKLTVPWPLLSLDASLVPGSGENGNAAKVSGTVQALCPAKCSVFVSGFWYGPDNLAQIHSLGGRTYTPTLDPVWGFGGFEDRWWFPGSALGFQAVAQATDQYGQKGNIDEEVLNTP